MAVSGIWTSKTFFQNKHQDMIITKYNQQYVYHPSPQSKTLLLIINSPVLIWPIFRKIGLEVGHIEIKTSVHFTQSTEFGITVLILVITRMMSEWKTVSWRESFNLMILWVFYPLIILTFWMYRVELYPLWIYLFNSITWNEVI